MADQEDRVPLVKAHVIGKDSAGGGLLSRALSVDDKTWDHTGAIDPPYDPRALCKLRQHSNALPQNIAAYQVNIDGFGHHFEPRIDLEADDIDEVIRAAMIEQRTHQEDQGTQQAALVPSDEEVAAKKANIAEEMAREKAMLERFFEFACPDRSFVALRRDTRLDLEAIGWACWEVIRNPLGEIVELNHVPAFTVRLRKLCDPIVIEEWIRTSALSADTRKVPRRFRTYVQKHENRTVYFKDFGDPRVVSSKTGREYDSIEDMHAQDPKDCDATELLYFRIPSPETSYGIPRWIGVLLAVLGSREAEEVNHAYFENKSIPPLVITVSGGRLTEETITELKDAIENEVKGKANFHKMLILEGEPHRVGQPENAGRMRIEIRPLTGTQHTDALFVRYDERNIDKIGGAFRLPRLLRGDVRDFNRATAQASLEYAERQVFAPEREDFDWMMNRKILADMGICFWRFVSNGPIQREPQVVVEMVARLVERNVLTPGEARDLLAGTFKQEIPKSEADWTKQPLVLTLAGIPLETEDNSEELSKARERLQRVGRTRDEIDEALTQLDLARELREVAGDQ